MAIKYLGYGYFNTRKEAEQSAKWAIGRRKKIVKVSPRSNSPYKGMYRLLIES